MIKVPVTLPQLYVQYSTRHEHITGHNKFPGSIRVSQFEVCMRIAEDYSLQACTNRIIKHSGLFILYDLYSFQLSTVMAMEI